MADPVQSQSPSASPRRNVSVLGVVSFINDTSSKIILPLLPLFIQQLGGGGLAVGVISGVSDSIASLFNVLSGYWTDRQGRRRGLVASGYLVSATAKLLLAFATLWPHVLVLRMAERLGKGVRSAPRDALLASATEGGRRGRGFGIHRALDSGGSVLGTLLAFWLFWYLGLAFTEIFVIAGLIGFLSVLPLIWVREPPRPPQQETYRFSFRRLSPTLKRFIFVVFLFALANFSYMFFVLASQGALQERLGTAVPILLYALYNLVYTVFAIPSGMLADRFGRRNVVLSGYGLFALVCLGFMVAESLPVFLLLFVLYGLNYALVNANERAMIADLAEPQSRGLALGSYHMAVSLAALPAGLIAGLLWDRSATYTFLFGTALATIAMVLLWKLIPAREITSSTSR